MQTNKATRAPGSERKFHLSMYYKIVTIYTIIVAVLYGANRLLYEKGYVMINTTIQYWLWYALVIGVVLLIGKFVSNLPKSPTTQRAVRICVGIVSVCTIFMMYVTCVNRIEQDFTKYSTMTNDSGKEVIIMRADLTTTATETEEAKVYTLYKAYPKINAVFCDGKATEDVIMLVNDAEATLQYEWSDDSLILKTEGSTLDDLSTITVPLK